MKVKSQGWWTRYALLWRSMPQLIWNCQRIIIIIIYILIDDSIKYLLCRNNYKRKFFFLRVCKFYQYVMTAEWNNSLSRKYSLFYPRFLFHILSHFYFLFSYQTCQYMTKYYFWNYTNVEKIITFMKILIFFQKISHTNLSLFIILRVSLRRI